MFNFLDGLAVGLQPSRVEELHRQHSDVHIVCAAVDRGLNEPGYVAPGLGDAGDRLYGTM